MILLTIFVQGLITVTVTDKNNCSIDTAMTLNSPSPLTLNITDYKGLTALANLQCTGLQRMSQVAKLHIVFYGVMANLTKPYHNLCNGNYSITVTDTNSCNAIKSFTITDSITFPKIVVRARERHYKIRAIYCYYM